MNRTQMLDKTPAELQLHRSMMAHQWVEKESELGKLIDQDHDCKGEGCQGCAKIQLKELEVDYAEKQVDLVDQILENEEYHFAIEYAFENDVSINEGIIKTSDEVEEGDESDAKAISNFHEAQMNTITNLILGKHA